VGPALKTIERGRSSGFAPGMTRGLLFVVLAAMLVGYSFWVYLRVELPVRRSRGLASFRALALVVILALLFDPRISDTGTAASAPRWVLLDASLSMAAQVEGQSAWDGARARAAALENEGWALVTFGAETAAEGADDGPGQTRTLLAPALERAAEAGARAVRVLSDLRFEDRVAVRAALDALPLQVDFEGFGADLVNGGISSFAVPDAPRPEGTVTAVVEFHGFGADNATLEIRADDEVVFSQIVPLPDPGLRRRLDVVLPVPEEAGRMRYSARLLVEGDAFASDDEAIEYSTVGHQEGALVLVSLEPDWEPRFLLSVLEDVTGLAGAGYLRVGPERFVSIGPAVERAGPVDSVVVGRAVRDAAMLVVHGLSGDADAWSRQLVERAPRSILLASDRGGAAFAGVLTATSQGGEWYASGDIPSSPLVAELAGAEILGLPPLTDVLLPSESIEVVSPLDLQLRGIGAPAAAFHLDDGRRGRRVLGLASGFWRWAMREGPGRDAYRRLWSGLSGWVLADESAAAAEPRPTRWVFARGDAVTWSVPGDSVEMRITILRGDSTVVDTVALGGTVPSLGSLPPGMYHYRAFDGADEELAAGRFDVSANSSEMIPSPTQPQATGPTPVATAGAGAERPLRTSPWPYLFLITLLCAEWVLRRRTGLR